MALGDRLDTVPTVDALLVTDFLPQLEALPQIDAARQVDNIVLQQCATFFRGVNSDTASQFHRQIRCCVFL